MGSLDSEIADFWRMRSGSVKTDEVKLTMNLPFDIIYVVQFSFDESSVARP